MPLPTRPFFCRQPLVVAIATTLCPVIALAQSGTTDGEDARRLDALQVTGSAEEPSSESTGSYRTGSSTSATKLALGHRETPQSISTVTRQQMDDYGQDDINDVLSSTAGVTVEAVETDRTYYQARGFDLTNFQYDGIGLPKVYSNIVGELDTAMYDRVEVLRGANGLMTGPGNPSATVNFVRKRPTAEPATSLELTGGSFDNRRVVGDVSGPLNEANTVRGRVVAGHQNRNSYLDRHGNERNFFYGALEADLTDSTLLTVGHSTQTSDTDGPLWGALPLFYSDGSPTDYKRSTSTSADWSYWDTTNHNSFVELQQELAGGWQAKAVLTRLETSSNSELFYPTGNPDPDTGEGLVANSISQYTFDNEQYIGDVHASGPFDLFDRTHELVAGATWSESTTVDESVFDTANGTTPDREGLDVPPLDGWGGDFPEPAYDYDAPTGSDFTDEQFNTYGVARWTLTDRLTAITGLRLTWLDSEGETYGVSEQTSYDAEEMPYGGLIYDLSNDHSVYTSYTTIFEPQGDIDENRQRLPAKEGKAYEIGLKSEFFDDRLNTGVAIFYTEQNNTAESAGTFEGGSPEFFEPVDYTSEGFEVDAAGAVTDNLQLNASYAYTHVEDEGGQSAKPEIPEHVARLRSTYRIPAVRGLKVGAQVRWQSSISQNQGVFVDGEEVVTRQSGYALADLMASYDFADRWNATLNLNNVTDEKYLRSLKSFGGQAQGYYGTPANASLSLRWRY